MSSLYECHFMNITFKNARLICPTTGLDTVQDLHIADGIVSAIGENAAKFTADRVIDGTGCILTTGFIDLSVRLREPGYEHKSAMATELAAAVSGGVTTVVCPPDTSPVLDAVGLVEMLLQRAEKVGLARVLPLGALTRQLKGLELSELANLAESGCVAFSQGSVPLSDTQVLSRALNYAKTYDLPIWLRPVDADLAGGVAASGAYATRMGLSGVPVAAESIALLTLFELLRSNPTPVHIQCISSARGVELVRQAKAQGLPITCDVSAYHLHWCDTDIGFFNAQMRFNPPLRSNQDRKALRAGLLDGTIDAVCSDHTPVDIDEKLLPFAEASAGASGVELLLSMTMQWAQQDGVPLATALACLTSGAAKVLRRDSPSLVVGSVADLVLFNLDAWKPVNCLQSQGQNTPFTGMELPAVVQLTVLGGRIVYCAP
jgi:dihydroorotase